MPSRGRPSKRAKRNISGLRNQKPAPSNDSILPLDANDAGGSDSDFEEVNSDIDDPGCHSDTARDDVLYVELDTDDNDDTEEDEEWTEVATEQFNQKMIEFAVELEEQKHNQLDPNWVPRKKAGELERAAKRQKSGECKSTWVTGYADIL